MTSPNPQIATNGKSDTSLTVKHGYRSGMPDLLIQIRSSFLEHPIPDPDPVPEAEDLQFQIQIQVQP